MAPLRPTATIGLVPDIFAHVLPENPSHTPALAIAINTANSTNSTNSADPRYTHYPSLDDPPAGSAKDPLGLTLLVAFDIVNGVVFFVVALRMIKGILNRRMQALARIRAAQRAREEDEQRARNGLHTRAEMREDTRQMLEYHDYLLAEAARWRSSRDGSLYPGAPEWLVRENELLAEIQARQARGEFDRPA